MPGMLSSGTWSPIRYCGSFPSHCLTASYRTSDLFLSSAFARTSIDFASASPVPTVEQPPISWKIRQTMKRKMDGTMTEGFFMIYFLWVYPGKEVIRMDDKEVAVELTKLILSDETYRNDALQGSWKLAVTNLYKEVLAELSNGEAPMA